MGKLPRRVARRLVLAVFAALAIAIVLVVTRSWLPALAHGRIASELAASGFPDARFRVRGVGIERVRLADVRLGPDLVIDELDVELDLSGGRIDALTLRGARWTIAPSVEALEASALARLVRRDGTASARGPRVIRVRDSRIVLEHGDAPIVIDVDGALEPRGDARFTLRSELGAHTLTLRSRETARGTTVHASLRSLDAAGDQAASRGPPREQAATLRVAVCVELGNDGDATAGVSARAERVHARGVDLSRVRLEGHAALDAGRLGVLELHVSSEGLEVGELALERAALHAAREGEQIRVRASLATKEGLHATLDGAAPRVLSELASMPGPLAWELSGPLPALALERRAGGLVLEGDPWVRARGLVRREHGALRFDDVVAEARVAGLAVPAVGIELADVRLEVEVHGVFRTTGSSSFVVKDGARLRAGRTQIEDLHLTHLELAPVVRVMRRGGRWSIDAGAAVPAHARTLAIGTGSSALRFEDVALRLAPRSDAPMVEAALAEARVGFDMQALAQRVRGILRGGRTQARASLDVDIGPSGSRIALPLDVRVRELSEAHSEVSLEEARVRLPLSWRDGVFGAEGRVEAARMAWRGVPIGAGRGSLRLSSGWLRLDWRGPATASSTFDAHAVIALGERSEAERGGAISSGGSGGCCPPGVIALGDPMRGSVRVVVPRAVAHAGDPISRVLAALTDMRVEGPLAGELELDVAAPEQGDAWLRLEGASVEEVDASGRARDVHGTLRFTHMAPLVSAEAPLTWGGLELGDVVRLGAGSATLRFERTGHVAVSEMAAAALGGRIHVAPFRFDWDAPVLALDVTAYGLELRRLARALGDERLRASGHVDGRVAMRVTLGDERRVLLGDGRFAARGPGTFRVGDGRLDPIEEEELRGMIDGRWIQRRVLAALADFEYRELILALDEVDGTRRLRAHVLGRGRRMPQELDLTLNVRGIQPLLDHALRLWPRAVRTRSV